MLSNLQRRIPKTKRSLPLKNPRFHHRTRPKTARNRPPNQRNPAVKILKNLRKQRTLFQPRNQNRIPHGPVKTIKRNYHRRNQSLKKRP